MVVVLGRTTHESIWVKREVAHAIREGVAVVPVLAGGSLRRWPELEDVHALTYERGQWRKLEGQVVAETHRTR